MREMKDSGIEWIGEIPSRWELSKIGTLYTERKTKVSDVDYPPLSVTMKGIVPQLATAAKTDAHDDRKLVCVGDFAINSRSDRRGSCGISAYDGSVSLINTILTPRNEMNPQYYNWLFHTVSFADEFYSWGHGIVNDLWTTNWQDMKRIQIPIPPIEEQKFIADYLDKKCAEIDAVIEQTKATIEEYKKLKQSVITEAVIKGIRGDRPMKDSGIEWIGEIPREWEVSKLKYVCQINTEFVDPRTGEYDNLPHIGPGNIEKFTGCLTEYKLVKDEGLISGKYHFYPNEIIYGKINPQLGKVTLPNFEGLCSADAYPIHTIGAKMEIKFLLYFMLSRGFIDATILASLRMGMPT